MTFVVCLLSALALAFAAFVFAVGANDEANDRRHRRGAFLGWCAAAVVMAALAVGQVAIAVDSP